MQSVTDLNLSLLASARAIVTERRGPRPAALPEPDFGRTAVIGDAYTARKAKIVAYLDRQGAQRSWDREVGATFRTLKADVVLAPVVALGAGRVMV